MVPKFFEIGFQTKNRAAWPFTAFFSTLVPGARLGRWYWRLCSSICLWQLGHSLVKDLGDVRGDFTSVQVKRLRRLGVELLKGQGQLLGRSSHLHNSYWLICDIEPYRSPGPSNFDVYSKLFNLMCPVFLTISKVRFGSRLKIVHSNQPLCTALHSDHWPFQLPASAGTYMRRPQPSAAARNQSSLAPDTWDHK